MDEWKDPRPFRDDGSIEGHVITTYGARPVSYGPLEGRVQLIVDSLGYHISIVLSREQLNLMLKQLEQPA